MAIFDKWWREVLHSGTPADADADAPAADDADDTDTATVANAAPAANTAAPAAAPAPVLPACECRFIPKDGHEEPRHLLWRALVFPGLAHVVYIHGLDLTERRQAERALLESETRFRRIADSAPVLIWMADASCRFFYFSNRWLEFTGRGLDREIGHGCFENLHPDDREAAVRRFQAHYVGRTAFRSEFRLRRHDGVYRRFVDHATPCVDAQGEFSGFVGSCLDVTEQHEIEALITRRALKQSVLASFNHFALALHSFDELARRAVKLILDTLHVDGSCVFMLNPGDQRLLLRYCAGRESGIPPGDFGRATGAMLARRQAIRLSDDPENFPAAAALASLDMRSGIASPVGAPPRIHAFVVAFSRSPRVFSNEAVDFIQGIANVLSTVHHREHVEAALAESEQKLLQSQKLEIAGLIASGVAHDFNNLLTAIRGYGELLKDKLPDSSTGILAPIDGLLKTTSRATNLVRRLLAFARKHPPAPGPIDLNTLVTDLHDLIASFLPPGIRCELKLHPRPVTLVADRNQLEQVLINFAINARDAMPAGGTLTIRTAIRELAPGEIPSLRPGAHAVLSVQDTGTGMTDEVKAKIFDPFFTTKPPGSGTGLGLPVCLNVIRHFHGELLLETAPGRGSTFQVLLPGDPAAADPAGGRAAAPEMPDARPAPPPDPDAAGNDPAADGGELIYLVEDDDDIREITSAILKSLGYRVRAFATAKAILAYIAKKKGADAPDLLISDIFISDMDGRKLGRHIGKIHPALPALFMSGHVDSPAQLDDAHFMAKPFTRDILARKVRQALNAPRAQE
jgi:PAS domain S-box-containing protein